MPLKTAGMKEFRSDFCVTMPGRLYIRILGVSMVQAAAVFADPKETVQIWCGLDYFAGFTHLNSVSDEGDAIKICLTKE